MANSPHNHAAFYNRIAKAYDLLANPGEARARREGEAALSVQAGETVLEVGFGTGNSLVAFATAVGPQGHVHGLDISESMLRIARARCDSDPELGRRVELQLGDARLLPFADASFDAVFSSFTLELFDDAEIPKVLAELHRVLKPGGRFGLVVMAVPNDPQHESLLEHAYVWMHRHFPHIVDCHPIRIDPLLTNSGLVIEQRRQIEIWTLPVDVVFARKPQR